MVQAFRKLDPRTRLLLAFVVPVVVWACAYRVHWNTYDSPPGMDCGMLWPLRHDFRRHAWFWPVVGGFTAGWTWLLWTTRTRAPFDGTIETDGGSSRA